MRVYMKNLSLTTTQSLLRASLLALGCADPERIAIVRPKGAGFAGGARYCSAFLWYSDERSCGETVVRVNGLLLNSDVPVFAEICEDRSVRQPLVMPRQVRQPVVVPPRVREPVGSATRVSVEPTSPLVFKRPRTETEDSRPIPPIEPRESEVSAPAPSGEPEVSASAPSFEPEVSASAPPVEPEVSASAPSIVPEVSEPSGDCAASASSVEPKVPEPAPHGESRTNEIPMESAASETPLLEEEVTDEEYNPFEDFSR
jgi:hypothetical protein